MKSTLGVANFHELPGFPDGSQADMRGAAHEAVFIYCEWAATKQIGLPGGGKVAIHIIDLLPFVLRHNSIANFHELSRFGLA